MDSIKKFQKLLQDLFQFDTSDLDFGIYRILNYKRDQIEKFINKDLVEIVDEAFLRHKTERLSDVDQKLTELKESIIQTLGKNAFTELDDLKNEFKVTPLGQKYLDLKERKDALEKIEEIKLHVFNDLYDFFSRYFEEGDFVPQYRFSIKDHKYAIPYNGEEVKLYWVNSDQYYIKTGLFFRDYTFKINDYKVIFRVVEAKEELGSNKATKQRFFVLSDDNQVEIVDKTIIIRFNYRELIKDESLVKAYELRFDKNKKGEEKSDKSKKFQQEKINYIIHDNNIKLFFQKEYRKDKDGNSISLLFYHLNRFTAKNTRDYFIHKNLKKFLSAQLDYFIKSEVLNIDILEKEKFLDKHITRAKVVREIGEKIIDFLSQIEDFQKRLWEKKKFVIKTEYVITTDRIPEEFYDEIWKNEEQKKEWQELGFEIPTSSDELKNKKLPIDTKYFTVEFKEKLLEKLTEKGDLDDLLDGLLIKSENWQALNILLNKYKEKIQTIYIDPPFNKEKDADYLYNVKYKDSTWISLLENRLILARDLLNEKGSIFVRCDYNGNWIVRPLMDEIFGKENFRNEIIIKRKRQSIGTPNKFEVENEYLIYSTKTNNYIRYDIFINKDVSQLKWTGFLKQGERNPPDRIFLGKIIYPPKNQHFSLVQEKVDKLLKEHYLRLKCVECSSLYYYDEKESQSEFIKKINENVFKYYDIKKRKNKCYGVKKLGCCLNCGSNNFKVEYLPSEIRKIGNNWFDLISYSDSQNFPTENSEHLLKRVVESASNEGDLVMDFFLGSGTTTAVSHKLKRKWIGVEMGEHFLNIVLPRMKKVLAYDKSGISKEKDVKEKYNEKTAGGFFKYQILEQYEDSLDNIDLKPNETAHELFKDEYLLRYFLEFETRDNPYLLNIDQLKNPFSYKLKVNLSEVGEPQEMNVDIPETFNYLLGIKVKKIKTRNNGKKYLFVLGEKNDKDIAIVWREVIDNLSEEDLKKDRDFIVKEIETWSPDVVYVNSKCVLTPKDFEVKYIESEFKKLMEG